MPQPPSNPRTLVTRTSRRDVLIAVAASLVLLAVVIFGVWATMKTQRTPSRNQLTGTIVEKYNTGEREKEISVGRKGLKNRETDSGYRLLVRVEDEGRTFELPVAKELYDSKKVGEKQSFIRPLSEQR